MAANNALLRNGLERADRVHVCVITRRYRRSAADVSEPFDFRFGRATDHDLSHPTPMAWLSFAPCYRHAYRLRSRLSDISTRCNRAASRNSAGNRSVATNLRARAASTRFDRASSLGVRYQAMPRSQLSKRVLIGRRSGPCRKPDANRPVPIAARRIDSPETARR